MDRIVRPKHIKCKCAHITSHGPNHNSKQFHTFSPYGTIPTLHTVDHSFFFVSFSFLLKLHRSLDHYSSHVLILNFCYKVNCRYSCVCEWVFGVYVWSRFVYAIIFQIPWMILPAYDHESIADNYLTKPKKSRER